MTSQKIGIVGGGLVGCLLGLYLRKRSYNVTIFESRPDPRLQADTGRSINLVITSRGLAALTGVSDAFARRVMGVTVPVFGRTLHDINGNLQYQAYGPDPSYCNFSVNRWELNTLLLAEAERAGCQMFFSHPLAHIDVATGTLIFYLQNPATTQLYQKRVQFNHIFGADGGGSRCRQALAALAGKNSSDVAQPLGYGYKELTIPVARDPTLRIDTDSLHIWPRGSHFMMALPNKETGSFTVTLYMHEKGDGVSFAALNTPEKVMEYFRTNYPDAIALMPRLLDEYARNPVGFLGTVFTRPWVWHDKLALIGDAAHAITPFFGQGCNAAFEDVMVLDGILARTADMRRAFAEYETSRKPNTDAIANMALDNFTEMMSKTADAKFLLEKAVENELAIRFPDRYVSRYALVTHSLVPYELCRQIGELQASLLSELCRDITSVEQVDYTKAKRLIDAKLTPFLAKHKITKKDFVFASPYYPTSMPKAKIALPQAKL